MPSDDENDKLNNTLLNKPDTFCEPSIIEISDSNGSFHDATYQSTPIHRRSERQTKNIPPQRLFQEMGIVTSNEPSSLNEAISCHQKDKWIRAMKEELSLLRANKTWKLVTLPAGKNLVGCKWVYKIKSDASGEKRRFKTRLVAQGFSQKLASTMIKYLLL